jgi:hypothetical protein
VLGALVLVTACGLIAYRVPSTPVVGPWLTGGRPYRKEAWRDAEAWVASRWEAGDVVLLHEAWTTNLWRYYERDRLGTVVLPGTVEERTPGWDRAELLARVPALASARHVYLVRHGWLVPEGPTVENDRYARILKSLLAERGRPATVESVSFPARSEIRVLAFTPAP